MAGDSANVLRVHGEARDFNAAGFEPKDHVEIGRQLGIIDMEAGAKVSGQKFAVLRGGAALLEMAIVQWALSEVAKRGYEVVLPERSPPVFVGARGLPRVFRPICRLRRRVFFSLERRLSSLRCVTTHISHMFVCTTQAASL